MAEKKPLVVGVNTDYEQLQSGDSLDGYIPYVNAAYTIDINSQILTGLPSPVNGTDAVNLDFLTDAIAEVVYTPDSLTLNTGTYVSGDVNSVKVLSDSDYYIVDEVTGVPGYDIEFDFSGIESVNRIWLHVYYQGLISHVVNVDLWNYNTTAWDTLTSFTTSNGLQFIDFVIDDTNYVDSGAAILRLYHISSGLASHTIEVDYVALAKAGLGASNEHGALLGLADDDHLQYLTEARADTWYNANHIIGFTSTYLVFVNADLKLEGTSKLTFDGTDFILAANSALSSAGDMILTPGANMAFRLSKTGDTRGLYAVDFQILRTADTQVASGERATIMSGYENTVNADSSTIVSGRQNLVFPGANYETYSCIVAGYQNQVQGYACTVCGGTSNTILLAEGAQSSCIVGGYDHTITGSYDTICGGYQNSVGYNFNTICGGSLNVIPDDSIGRHTIGGGYQNVIVLANTYNGYNFIGGGTLNSIQGQACIIGGGYNNDIALADGVLRSVIAGGRDNTLASAYTIVGGGRGNSIGSSCEYSIICGGYLNTIPDSGSSYNIIAGGYSNAIIVASGNNGSSTISGGYDNSIQGSYCGVLSGYSNEITLAVGAIGSVIVGGYENLITSNYSSIIGGRNAKTDKYGQVTQASGRFSADGDAQTSVLTLRCQTTNDTQTEMFLNGTSARITIPENTAWYYTIKVIARQTNSDYTVQGYHEEGLIKRDSGGNATITNFDLIEQFVNDFGWSYAASADTTNQALIITVTGATDETINWVARVELVEVTG